LGWEQNVLETDTEIWLKGRICSWHGCGWRVSIFQVQNDIV